MIGAVLKDEFKAPFVVDAALDAGFIINATDEHTLRFLPPLKDKVGNAEDKLGDALKKDAAQKKSSSDDAAEGDASEETK